MHGVLKYNRGGRYTMKKTAVIILAGGQGTRFGTKKQFIQFLGKELWRHIYDKINKYINKEDIIVVGVDILGGITRSQSVINGICAFEEKKVDYERMIILEAARPLVTKDQIELILNDTHDSSTFALPLISTIVGKEGTYLNRDEYYRLSTPEAFDYDLFVKAYLSNKYFDMTDDTRVMYDHYGIKPYFLEGAENLLKLTYQSDLYILENLAKKYE